MKKLEFTSKNTIIIQKHAMGRGNIIGKSFYGELDHKGEQEPFRLQEFSHIVRKFVSIAEPAMMDTKHYVEIEFLEKVHTSQKSKKAYELIENGIINGTIRPIPVLVGNILVRMDLVYCADPANPTNPEAFNKYIVDSMEGMDDIKSKFKDADDMKALELCQEHWGEVEIMNDNDGSWVQCIDGIEDEDILYDFKDDFGNRDGIYNLFKKLGIKAKSV